MGNEKWEMRNEEMGRWHIAFHSANCWHLVTAVIKCDEKERDGRELEGLSVKEKKEKGEETREGQRKWEAAQDSNGMGTWQPLYFASGVWLRHFSTTCTVHIEDCDGWWYVVVAQWQNTGCTSQVYLVWFLLTASLCTFLYFHLITSKFFLRHV